MNHKKWKQKVQYLVLAIACSLLGQTASASADGHWRETVTALAEKNFKHPAWGYNHSVRVYSLAKDLAVRDNVKLNDDVLFAASYLHDMATFAPWAKEGLDHADQAALLVDTVLKETDFPVSKIEAVREAIRTHMHDRTPVAVEATYLHDADALDWLGAIGVVRLLALVDPAGGVPDSATMIKAIEQNLAKVPERIFSPAGRLVMSVRREQTDKFLKDLRQQSIDFQAL